MSWRPLDILIEPDAVDIRLLLDAGYSCADDDRIVDAVSTTAVSNADVIFGYLVAPDLAGHEHGWGSTPYLEALAHADRSLAALVAAAGTGRSVLVTTDHGGHGTHHVGDPVDEITFIALRSEVVAPATTWRSASILDIAPTACALAGVGPHPGWHGASLIGREASIADGLIDMLATMADVSYGERMSMLSHSTQTATLAHQAGATDDLVLAGLLHDVGHLLGAAGRWGLPDHASVGARFLQQSFPASVVEPIRLHVESKRFLVATDPGYTDRLSAASLQTLAQQGGPLDAAAVETFERREFAQDSVALRRFDDDAKMAETSQPDVEDWRGLIESFLAGPVPSARTLRDRCRCSECVDLVSGQRLLSVDDLAGWKVTGRRGSIVELCHHDGAVHHVDIGRADDPCTTTVAEDRSRVEPNCHDANGSLDGFVADVVEHGLALAEGLACTDESVLDFAGQIGYLRETNYGRMFDVRSVPDPTNLAYSTLALPLHTDNPYRDPTPTVQVLHCLRQADQGGENLFADGFTAAAALRLADPAAFKLLTTQPLSFQFVDPDVHLESEHTMISLGPSGQVVAIHVNHRSMVPPRRDAEAFYAAYQAFVDCLDRATIRLRLEPGQVVAFDNRRVLHARSGFGTGSHRHLQGCYIDIDALRSTHRSRL